MLLISKNTSFGLKLNIKRPQDEIDIFFEHGDNIAMKQHFFLIGKLDVLNKATATSRSLTQSYKCDHQMATPCTW